METTFAENCETFLKYPLRVPFVIVGEATKKNIAQIVALLAIYSSKVLQCTKKHNFLNHFIEQRLVVDLNG